MPRTDCQYFQAVRYVPYQEQSAGDVCVYNLFNDDFSVAQTIERRIRE
jgi:hypothetical protein